ncbi:hypothetical protein GCM10025857_36450 [Alicyclobacillus contaminans]|nr:hypothetical protein GCM10025857_36450 [Alicyclobacillus contaminans]
MKIYTRSGDEGKTSLIHGRRVSKDSPRVEAYGTVDEANSAIGAALALMADVPELLNLVRFGRRVQRDLFDVGRDLATPEEKRDGFYIAQSDVDLLERMIDKLSEETPPLRQFVLPGASCGRLVACGQDRGAAGRAADCGAGEGRAGSTDDSQVLESVVRFLVRHGPGG